MFNVFLIAEIGQAHEGSLGIAHSYIDALSQIGVDAIKFQTHIAEAESSVFEPFRIHFSYEDQTRFGYWKRMEFTFEQWAGLKQHCDDKGIQFISSAFSNAAVDMLIKLDVKIFKIGSGEVNNFLMLKKIGQTKKPVILSSGMSSFEELDKSINFLKTFGNDLSILQCTTAYPTKPENWGLNVIGELKSRYRLPVGYSDHSGDIFACLAATALEAEILEFHIVFDKNMFGPDTKASLTIDQTKQLIKGVREIEESINHPIDKNDNSQFNEVKGIFEKSLAVNQSLEKGERIKESMLEAKKPKGKGIDAAEYEKVVGKKLTRDINKWDFITENDIE